jgi:hypothetical protein
MGMTLHAVPSANEFPIVLQIFQEPLVMGVLVVIGGILIMIVAVITLGKGIPGLRSHIESGPENPHQPPEANDGTGIKTETNSSTEGVDEATLQRLEPIVPEAVETVRNWSDRTESGQPRQRLYAAVKDTIDHDQLDMSHSSVYGESYEIVNLPTHLRDIQLTSFSGQHHVQGIEGSVRDWIADDDIPLQDLSIALDEITDHKVDIADYIQTREAKFEENVKEITEALDDATAIANQIDGQLGERFRMLVVENRDPQVTGVRGVESGIEDAKADLHRCAFDKAIRQIRDCKRDAENLLVAVDFFRSFIGGIEHGQRSVDLPNETAAQLCFQLTDLLEKEYGVEISKEDGQLLIDGSHIENESEQSVNKSTGQREAVNITDSESDVRNVHPEEVTDEILYIFRDLKQKEATGNTIEIQTELLPDSVGQPSVLQELVSFCQRRSDVVKTVTFQDGAPPGFLEIQFVETTTVEGGLESLANAFADRYGSQS